MLPKIRSRLGLIPLVFHYNASMYVCTPQSSPALSPEKSANDQVERRAACEPSEADLSTSSTPYDAQRRRPACPLQPLVRGLVRGRIGDRRYSVVLNGHNRTITPEMVHLRLGWHRVQHI